MDDPRNPALEAAIAADPYDREAYLVYADWLEGQGDPRAKLIALQCASHPAQNAGKAIRKLLADHQKYLLGPLARFAKSLSWKYGFVHEVALDDAAGSLPANLAALVEHPSARFLAELGVSSKYLAEAMPALAATPPTLRVLSLGHEGPKLVSLAPLAAVLPRLVSLSLHGAIALDVLARVQLPRLRALTIRRDGPDDLRGALALPELKTLVLRGPIALDVIDLPAVEVAELELVGASSSAAAAVAAARWPALRRLVLVGSIADADRLAPLLARTDLPALAELAIRGAANGEVLCDLLARSPLARQLRTLELSRGTLHDGAAQALAARPDVFDKLEVLDATGNDLGEDGHAALDDLAVPELLADRYDDAYE